MIALGVNLINFFTKFYFIYYLGGLGALGGLHVFGWIQKPCQELIITIFPNSAMSLASPTLGGFACDLIILTAIYSGGVR